MTARKEKRPKVEFKHEYEGFIEESRENTDWIEVKSHDVETHIRLQVGDKKYFNDDIPVIVTVTVCRK